MSEIGNGFLVQMSGAIFYCKLSDYVNLIIIINQQHTDILLLQLSDIVDGADISSRASRHCSAY